MGFWFVDGDHHVHKWVHHFLLRPIGGSISTADHEVTEVAWVPLADLANRLRHADERHPAQQAVGLLSGGDLGARVTAPGDGISTGN